jgi:CPA1 family monovalent cation:H+ antiporter
VGCMAKMECCACGPGSSSTKWEPCNIPEAHWLAQYGRRTRWDSTRRYFSTHAFIFTQEFLPAQMMYSLLVVETLGMRGPVEFAPAGILPAGWSDFARPDADSTGLLRRRCTAGGQQRSRIHLECEMTPSTAIEFLILVMLAASAIAVLAARWKIPYTVALVAGGLLLGSVHFPLLEDLFSRRPNWLAPETSLVIFLPALLFEGSLKIQIGNLRKDLLSILLLANVGVLASAIIFGYSFHWVMGIPLLVALVYGATVAATDPISVLAIFEDMAVDTRLSTVIEGESLFNDGSAVVIYGILLAAVMGAPLNVAGGIRTFLVEVIGGAAIGLTLGYVFSKTTERIDDPEIEITLTTILAYGAYLAARALHLSGVIATVTAGLMIGNLAIPHAMSSRSRVALWSFWKYVSFLMNSVLFLLIGLEVHVWDLIGAWRATALAVAAVLAGRALSVYGLLPLSNLIGPKVSLKWQHMLVWGGMRGALSLALALSLPNSFPYRSQFLTITFGVVAFTIVVQGVTIKPLIRALKIAGVEEDEYSRARVRQIAVTSAISELEEMLRTNLISAPVHEQLRRELDTRLSAANRDVQASYTRDPRHLRTELELARTRLLAAEKSAIEQSLQNGWISTNAASAMIEELDERWERQLAAPSVPADTGREQAHEPNDGEDQ